MDASVCRRSENVSNPQTSFIRLAQGTVYHSREDGIENQFRYPIFYIQFRTDQETELHELLKTRFRGLLSLNSFDYLLGNSVQLDLGVRDLLRERCHYEADEIWLQTIPRMFGFAFNPISFWICKKGGQLDAVLCEVRNTFGEKHFYFIRVAAEVTGQGQNEMTWVKAEKVFHVSPFFPVSGHYLFRFRFENDRFQVQIKYQDQKSNLLLVATTDGIFSPLLQTSRFKLLFKYGWMTPLVVFRIHYQAVKLYFKKAKFYKKPDPPKTEISA